MKVGVIVDGQAEFQSLPKLLARLENPHTVLKPLYADIQPMAPPPQIARAAEARLRIMAKKGVETVIVLIDREGRSECPGNWALRIQKALAPIATGIGITTCTVVIKNSCYENWLISDVEALQQMPKRFKLSAADVSRIAPDKADRANAQTLLKRTVQGSSYDKIKDAVRIMNHAEPLRMAANSRSFRRLMRMLDNPAYSDQSRRPLTT